MFVKPAPGRQVLMPDAPMNGLRRAAAFMPAEGAEVQATQYWNRRLACGDVVPATPPAPAAEPAPPVTGEG